MAKNDVVLLDALIQERVGQGFPSKQPDEVFEYFAFEQILKDLDPSRDEIESGWVDGRDDGGIDGFFTVVNGHFLQDSSLFQWPRRNAEIEVHIITCKHHETFQQAALNAMVASLTELLDLSSDERVLKTKYSADLLLARGLLIEAYRTLSSARPTLTFRFTYASRGDSKIIGESVRTRSEQVVSVTEALFSQCKAIFQFVGAAELVELYRRTKSFSLDLQTVELMATGVGSYVGVVRLGDYYDFVRTETGARSDVIFSTRTSETT